MSADIAELREKVAQARAVLDAAQAELNEAIVGAATRKVGERVTHRKRLYEITSILVRYDRPQYFGKRVCKDGSLGALETELWSLDWT